MIDFRDTFPTMHRRGTGLSHLGPFDGGLICGLFPLGHQAGLVHFRHRLGGLGAVEVKFLGLETRCYLLGID